MLTKQLQIDGEQIHEMYSINTLKLLGTSHIWDNLDYFCGFSFPPQNCNFHLTK